MSDGVSLEARVREGLWTRVHRRARACAPSRIEIALAALSGALLIISFPDFNLWPLAWVALVPLLIAVAREARPASSFLLGWITGTVFFYGSCYWLTYAMIRYGGIPTWISFLLIVPPVIVVGLFPAMCSMVLARAVARWGTRALLLTPIFWAALEWARLGLTGQLWNAIGYSQAYVPPLIQSARWGGVYLVGFLIVAINAVIAYMLVRRKNAQAWKLPAITILLVAAIILIASLSAPDDSTSKGSTDAAAIVVAVQPNVPMESEKSLAEIAALVERHYQLSESGLEKYAEMLDTPRVIIWPESPMTFRYADDSSFRELIARFAARTRASILFNSQEPAPARGTYNSAVMVNEEGRLVAQYDKIRLLPFGEYVPLPRWLPGVSYIPTMVGDFTPGAEYILMPMGRARAGVFICFESAFPSISRQFAYDGADLLVNISNDGYLGETPVMRQHLANAIFRAVENNRPVVRVTNTGITAFVTERGQVLDETAGFQPDVRTWVVKRVSHGKTFYTRYGDLFAGFCGIAGFALFMLTFRRKPSGSGASESS